MTKYSPTIRSTPKTINIQIGDRCRRAREAAGYTQEQLAERIGVSTQFISDAERVVSGMSVSTIIKLCTVLVVSADFILLGNENQNNTEESFSVYSRLQQLSPQEQALVKEVVNLMIKSFHMSK